MKRLLQAYRCSDPLEAKRQLRRWYASPLGRRLHQAEQTILDQVLPNLFGFHLLQVGGIMDEDMLSASRIVHRMIMDDLPPLSQTDRSRNREQFRGQADQLPVAGDSIDVLLLPHTLEFIARPHEVLREAERVLIPEGHVVILGFNPWGLYGGRRLLGGWRNQSPWCGHFFSTFRIKDWLALLGFDVVLVRHYSFRPPMQNESLMRHLQVMERWGERLWPFFSGGYLLVAKKRVTTLTPIKPRWRSRRSLIVSPVEPTVRRNKS